jgi:ketosteroid isomerase-like protein
MSTPNLDTAVRFIRAMEYGASGEALLPFFQPDATQREHPNRLFPSGATRDLRAMMESSKKGKQVLSAQRYEIQNTVAAGDHVAVELEWSGTLAIPLGNLPVGGTLRAHIGMFFTFRDGRIASIRNYDCYEPF